MMAPEKSRIKSERSTEVQHDETPSGITDHAFEPKSAWWTLCKICNFAESAHAETTIRIHYVSDDIEDED